MTDPLKLAEEIERVSQPNMPFVLGCGDRALLAAALRGMEALTRYKDIVRTTFGEDDLAAAEVVDRAEVAYRAAAEEIAK